MKIGNLYNLDSFKTFMDSAKKPGFADAYAGTVLSRNLTAVDPRLFEKKFPELTFVNSGVQADNSGGYARRIQSLRVIDLGGFTTSGDASANKGRISLMAEDSFLKVIVREADSVWTEDEIKEAELQNINLVQRYVQAHNAAYMREIDQIGLLGGVAGIGTGLLNHAGFTATPAGGAIEALTAQQMYDAIASLITDQHNAVNNTPEYMADRVIMPIDVMNKLSVTILNSAAGSSSVMRALQDNFGGVQFMASFRAANTGAGVSATVAFSSNDEVMKMRIPVPLTIGEIIKQGSFDYKVDSKYRIAGLDVLENTGGRILTGL
jgi:hypothetical protein